MDFSLKTAELNRCRTHDHFRL